MKTLQQFMIVLVLCMQTICFGQERNFTTISEKMNPLLKEQHKGISILVKKEDQIYTASLGDFNLTEKTVFNIASATKTFTAVLILQEFEKRNLLLTDRVDKFLTPIQNVPQSLTIENLLTHQSGLDEIAGNNMKDIFYAQNDSLYNTPLLQQVGAYDAEKFGKFDYCNTNYFLLGSILEKVTDRSFFDLVNERIIKPLQLKNTHPYLNKNIPNLAKPFYKGEDVTAYLDYRYFSNIVYAAGSIASTLLDMEKFYTSLFETETLLKQETVKMMMESGNNTYGLGLFKSNYDDHNYYGHGGNNVGYAFRNGYDPITKSLYLMFTNSERIPAEKLATDSVLDFLHDKKTESFHNADISTFKNYIGTYVLGEANLTLKIIQEANKLYLVVESQGIKSVLMQKNENTLFDTTVGVHLSIIEGNNNKLTFTQNGFETTIDRIANKG